MDPQEILKRSTLLRSASEVEAALERMAEEITADLGHADPVVVAVMNGGAFTAVGLCRYFRFRYEFDYVHATRYGQALEGGLLEWRARPQASLEGRAVLLVDDVLDKGTTLAGLLREFRRIGVGELRTAVLVRKRIAAADARPHVDYFALESDDVYLFGCGMDYAGYWRGLPELYACDVS
ncbi:MAG TPA: hypoxanthine-guanine phosphoribosyltransferase [Gammaproteobacteria bacterium]|nr:hypoxanthine-guanine phosphoribosyltransferase [Gammaproteobacteria bacterium]